MRGRRTVAGAFTKRAMVAALTMSSVFVVMAPATPTVQAYNGGVAYTSPAAQPCLAPCSFVGDNTGGGLAGFTTGFPNSSVTWWSFTPTESKTYTIRAHSTDRLGWDNTLTLTSTAGTIVAANDDDYGLDAMISPTLTAGTEYRLGLGSYGAETGLADVSISSSPPDAPADLVGVAGDGQVSLTWTAPNDHYAAITAYTVYVVDTATVATFTGEPPVAAATISGLTNGVEYSFEVTAVNGNGESEPSIESATYVPFGATTTSITFDPASPTYGSSFDVVVTVSGSSTVNSGTVTLYRSVTNLGSHNVVGGTATWTESNRPVGPETYRAEFTGLPAWTSSSSGQVGVTVGKADQTITFAQPADTAHATGSITLAPSTTSPLTVALTSSTTSVCTVSGFVVTLGTGGTCTLTASQAGNGNYFAATSIERSFQVTEAPQTITFAQPADRAWSASTFVVAPTASSGLTVTLTSGTTSVCTVSGFTVTMVRTGTCTLTAAHAGNANFVAASLPRSFLITGASQTVTFAQPADRVWSASTFDVAPTASTELTVTLASDTTGICTVSGFTVTLVRTGSCTLTATQAGNAQYASGSQQRSFLITAATQSALTAAADSYSLTVGGTTGVGASGGTGTGDVSYAVTSGVDHCTLAGATLTATAAGTCVVTATKAADHRYAAASDATDVITVTAPPAPPAALIPTVPTRIIDTRPDYPHVRPAPDRVLDAGEVLEVQFTDLPGLVPASGVNAVAIDIGVVTPDGDGFVTAYPCGDRPTVSSLNFRTGQTISNAAIVPVNDTTGAVCFSASRATHLIVDITGWFATGNGFVDVAPSRLVDTRPGKDALRPLTGSFSADQVREVTVTDIAGLVPAQGVAAVSLNLTVVSPAAAGYVSAYACGDRPNASSVNFSAGRTVANLAIVPVSASGTVCFYASQSLHLIVDVTGWFEVGHGFDASGPARVFDTRPGYSGLRTVASERIGGATMLTVKVTDLAGLVPADGVGAVSLNVTAIDPEGDGFLTVWACGPRPDASSLNFAAHRTTAGAVLAPVDPSTGTVCFYSSQNVYLAVDINGWFVGNIT